MRLLFGAKMYCQKQPQVENFEVSWNRVREGGPRRLGRTLLPLLSQLPILGTETSTGNNHVPPLDKVGQLLFQIQ